jgi:hypothetical protein
MITITDATVIKHPRLTADSGCIKDASAAVMQHVHITPVSVANATPGRLTGECYF